MSPIRYVICHPRHMWSMTQMTDDTKFRWQSWYRCLKKWLNITSQAGSIKLNGDFFWSIQIGNTTAEISPSIILEVLCTSGFESKCFEGTLKQVGRSWFFCVVSHGINLLRNIFKNLFSFGQFGGTLGEALGPFGVSLRPFGGIPWTLG